MCECIEVITNGGYVGKSILGRPNYLLYPLEFKYDGKVKVKKEPYLFIDFCPVCGKELYPEEIK